MDNKISIITISYNSEKTIKRTIESVLHQTYRPLEYIFVDGGSSDGTIDIINSYIEKFKQVNIDIQFVSEPDNGISDAFNKGIKMAHGDIIGIINSDDCIVDNILQTVADNFWEQTDVLYGNCIWNDEENNIRYVRKSSADLSDLKIRLRILHPAAYIKRSAYEKYGKYSTEYKYCMDKQLLAKMQRMGAKFRYIDMSFTEVSAGGISDKNLKEVMKEGEKIAIENGISSIRSKMIFRKGYLITELKMLLKRIPMVYKYIRKIKRSA